MAGNCCAVSLATAVLLLHIVASAGTNGLSARCPNNMLCLPQKAAAGADLTDSSGATSRKPVISDVRVSSITPTSARITWETNVAADTMAFWSGSGDDYIGYGRKSPVADTAGGVTSHSVTLTGLIPGTSYWYGVRSRGLTDGSPDNRKISLWEDSQSQNRFNTAPAPTTGSFDYVIALYGPHHVFQGYTMYIGSLGTMLNGTASFRNGSYKLVITNLPPYTAIHWPLREIIGQGSISTTYARGDTLATWSPQQVDIGLETNVGGITPAGSYALKVKVTTQTAAGAGPTNHLTWNIVVDTATALPSHPPASYPSIPNLRIWEANMLKYGAKWCGQTGSPYEQGVWYYDGIRVYQQIRAYSRDSATWTPCINSVLLDYRDRYVLPNNGAVPLHRQFSRGLYDDFAATGSAESSKAILEMGKHSGHSVSASNMRESAYSLDTYRLAAKLGGRYPWMAVDISNLIGMAEQVSDNTALWYQPFMCGLLAEALINYYEDGHQDDIRIPHALKAMADALWKSDWRPELNGFVYNSFRASIGFPEDGSTVYLNQLIAPMYAWLFRYTGDPRYQMEGDAIWNSAVLADPAGGIAWSGKNYSQNYRWSFDYVKWRSGR